MQIGIHLNNNIFPSHKSKWMFNNTNKIIFYPRFQSFYEAIAFCLFSHL